MKVRIYKRENGTVMIDTPSEAYQKKIEQCPHPWEFRNPKTKFTMQIMDYEELKKIAINNQAGGDQFYHENGVLKHDNDRSLLLMHPEEIKSKHYSRLVRKIDQELEKETPDAVKLMKWQREREKVKDMTEKEAYQQAIKNLDEDGLEKPIIRQKLAEKVK